MLKRIAISFRNYFDLQSGIITLIGFAIFLLAFEIKIYASEPTIRSSVDKKEIGVGEKINLTVEMEWKEEKDSSIIVTQITPPSSPLLEMADSKQRTSSQLRKNGVFGERILEYVYIGRKKGKGDIDPAVIEYAFSDDPENKKIIKTQPIPFEVISRAARFGKKALWSTFIMLTAALFFGLFAIIRRHISSYRGDSRKERAGDSGEIEKRFCEKLQDLNKHRVSGDVGVYYAGIEKALSDYVKEKYNSDLSPENMGRLPEELQKICAESKLMAERVRFSGYQPQVFEQDNLIRGINKYMRSLMSVESEEDSIETIDHVER